MATADLAEWLRLSLVPGVGNDAARRLLAAFGLPNAIFSASESALKQVVTDKQAKAILQIPQEFEAQWANTQAWLAGTTVADARCVPRRLVIFGEPGYPVKLLDIDDPPILVYVLTCGS